MSLQPVRSLWKSEIMEICAYLGAPQQTLDMARQPDCLCGRDELAASNIELIDAIVRRTVVPSQHDPVLLDALHEYVRGTMADNAFRQRVPFLV